MSSNKKAIELWLCRHGETEWNRSRRIQGQLDIPLNPLGQAQARRLGEVLADQKFQAVVSSPLGRALQTAAPLAQLLDAAVLQRPAWAERHFGELQGQSFEDMAQVDPQAAAHWEARTPDFCPTGGESLLMLQARVVGGLQDLLDQDLGTKLVCFTHGGVLDMVYRQAHGLDVSAPREWGIPNAGINRLVLQSGPGGELRLEMLSWGQIDHLGGLEQHESLGV
ncbi:MAG: hypothetical protein RL483_1282 [Pseudomonadota bacterium]